MTAPARHVRWLAWLSRLSVAAAIVTALIALVSRYGVNAPSLGAHQLGLAIDFSFVLALALIGAFYAVPVLLVLGAVTFYFQRHAAYRFFAAAAICALPLAVVSLL